MQYADDDVTIRVLSFYKKLKLTIGCYMNVFVTFQKHSKTVGVKCPVPWFGRGLLSKFRSLESHMEILVNSSTLRKQATVCCPKHSTRTAGHKATVLFSL